MRKIILVILFMSFVSCSKQTKTKSFYLRLPSKSIEQTIKFKCNETNDIQYWKVSSNKTGSLIKIKRLNKHGNIIDEIIEKITDDGSKMVSYSFIDDSEEFPLEIKFYPELKDILKWNLKEKSIYKGEFVYKGIIYKLERERTFLKKEKNKSKDVLVFNDEFLIQPKESMLKKKEGVFLNRNYTQTTYFEKNKGLVRYDRLYPDGEKRSYEIVDLELENKSTLNSEKELIKSTLIDMWDAIEKGDIDRYSSYVHDDFTQFGEYDSVLRSGKAAEIKGIKEWIESSTPIHTEMHDPKVTINGNTAFITYYWSDSGSTNSKPFATRGKSTRIFVKEHGKWLCIHGHYTLLP